MVSKASDDFPEPDSPVITTRLSRGRSTSMFLRLCSRAPRMRIDCINFPGSSGCPTLQRDGLRCYRVPYGVVLLVWILPAACAAGCSMIYRTIAHDQAAKGVARA